MSKWYPGLDAPLPMPPPWPHELVDAKPRDRAAPVQMISLATPWRPSPVLAWGVLFGIICWLLRDFWIGVWFIGPAW